MFISCTDPDKIEFQLQRGRGGRSRYLPRLADLHRDMAFPDKLGVLRRLTCAQCFINVPRDADFSSDLVNFPTKVGGARAKLGMLEHPV